MLFEAWAHRRICTGLTVNVRHLATGAVSTWTLPRLRASRRPLLTGSTVSACEYVQPPRSNESAVDAVLCCDLRQGQGDAVLLLQMTISPVHSVQQQAILDLLDWVKQSGIPCKRLVFVVPPDVYGTFTNQAYTNKDGRVLATSPAVEQWALEMPLSIGLSPPMMGFASAPANVVAVAQTLAASVSVAPVRAAVSAKRDAATAGQPAVWEKRTKTEPLT